MEEKITKILGTLDYSELIRIQKDLESGGLFLQQLVTQKVREVETTNRKFCASCGKDMQTEKDDIYTLLFGEKTMKKKASFCGIDCLESFTDMLKEHKTASLRTINRRL